MLRDESDGVECPFAGQPFLDRTGHARLRTALEQRSAERAALYDVG